MSKQIFLDLDGVLVNLHAAFCVLHNLDYNEVRNHMDFTSFVGSADNLWIGTDAHWWASLPWMYDGRRIVDVCESSVGTENVFICTKPSRPDSALGKLLWIERYLPEYVDRYVMTRDKSCCASSTTLLIDDDPENVKAFHREGGASILCPRPWNNFPGYYMPPDVPMYLQERIEEMLQ